MCAISFVFLKGRYHHGEFATFFQILKTNKGWLTGFLAIRIAVFFRVDCRAWSDICECENQKKTPAYTCGSGLYPRTMELDTVCVWPHFPRHWWRSGLNTPKNKLREEQQLPTDLNAFFFLKEELVFPLQQYVFGLKLSWSDVIAYHGGRSSSHTRSGHLHFHLTQLL